MALADKSIQLYRRLRLALHSLCRPVLQTAAEDRRGGWSALAVILVRHFAENEFLDSNAVSRILILV